MRKAIKYLAQIGILLLFTAGVGVWSYNITRWLCVVLNQKSDTVHIFFEPYATTPELGGLLAFAALPPETPKVIAWHRMPRVRERLDLVALNTYEVDIPEREGMVYTAMNRLANTLKMLALVHPEWKKAVVYTNMHHVKTMLVPFLRRFPQFEIAHIHFYEDGFANVIGTGYDYYKGLRYPDINVLNEKMRAWQQSGFKDMPDDEAVLTSFQLLYPVTYHLGHGDKIKNDRSLRRFVAHVKKGGKLESLDFQKAAATLTPAQKDIVFRAVGFDAAAWEAQNKGKTVFVFTLGYVFNNENRMKAQAELLRRQIPPSPAKPACWIKEHPSMSAESAERVLAGAGASCKMLPKSLPFEVLLMAEPAPDIVAGYSSSLFYAVAPERISAYIPRSNNDRYTRRLKEMGILTDKKIHFVHDLLKK